MPGKFTNQARFVSIAFCAMAPIAMYAQRGGEAFRDCQRQASVAVDAPMRDVRTTRGRDVGRGYIIDWDARDRRGRNFSGYCEVNRNDRVVRFERTDAGGGNGGGAPIDSYPRVRVDTAGRGSYNGPGSGGTVRRGFVDTQGRATVGVSGGNFRVSFYGDVERSNNDREFTIRITGSDRGSARGRAQIRLNPDRNEVEMINIDGQMGRRNFSANFNRS